MRGPGTARFSSAYQWPQGPTSARFGTSSFEHQHAAVFGRECQQVEHRLGISRPVRLLNLDLAGKPLGRSHDQRAGHHVQALFEIDSDGLLSGLGHLVIACGMGRVMTSSRSVVVTGDGNRVRLRSAGIAWELGRTWR